MKRNLAAAGLYISCVLILVPTCDAAVPQMMNYQGKLTGVDGKLVADGTHEMVFAIYDVDSGGTPLWTETWDGGAAVQVTNGLFSALLGSHNPLAIPFDENYWLEVRIKGDTSYSTLIPRLPIGSAAYSINAGTVDGKGWSTGNPATGIKDYVDSLKVDAGSVLAPAGGTIPVQDSFSGPEGSQSFSIPDGYYSGKSATAVDSQLSAENIKSGVDILGVTGTVLPTGGDATAADVAAGKAFYGAGQTDWVLQTGTAGIAPPDYATWNIVPEDLPCGKYGGNGSLQTVAGSYCEEYGFACDNGECACTPTIDCDGDGHTIQDGTDCDERCDTCFVGSTAYSGSPDGLDQDCDGSVDELDTYGNGPYLCDDCCGWVQRGGGSNCSHPSLVASDEGLCSSYCSGQGGLASVSCAGNYQATGSSSSCGGTTFFESAVYNYPAYAGQRAIRCNCNGVSVYR